MWCIIHINDRHKGCSALSGQKHKSDLYYSSCKYTQNSSKMFSYCKPCNIYTVEKPVCLLMSLQRNITEKLITVQRGSRHSLKISKGKQRDRNVSHIRTLLRSAHLSWNPTFNSFSHKSKITPRPSVMCLCLSILSSYSIHTFFLPCVSEFVWQNKKRHWKSQRTNPPHFILAFKHRWEAVEAKLKPKRPAESTSGLHGVPGRMAAPSGRGEQRWGHAHVLEAEPWPQSDLPHPGVRGGKQVVRKPPTCASGRSSQSASLLLPPSGFYHSFWLYTESFWKSRLRKMIVIGNS